MAQVDSATSLPRWRRIWSRADRALRSELGLALLMIAVFIAVAEHAVRSDQIFELTLVAKAAILGLAGVGLNLALGSGGLVSLGHAAFFGAGGYVAGVLAINAFNGTPVMTWPIEIAGSNQMLVIWPAAIVVGFLLAAAIGAMSLRSSGVYFIMITLAFAQMLYYFAISWPAYGGEDGLPYYLRNELPGVDTGDPLTFFFICLAFLGFALFVVWAVLRSRFGLALEVSRQNPDRLEAVGVAAFPIRLLAFTISGAITGLAGALFAELDSFAGPHMMSWHISGELIVFVILGGVARLSGPVFGAGLFILLEELLSPLSTHWHVFLGVLLLVTILWAKGGLVQLLAGARRRG